MSSRVDSSDSRIWRFALLGVALALFPASMWVKSLASQGRPLPDGPGKEETQKLCSQCHELERSISLYQDREGWQKTIEKMMAFGMKGTDKELTAVVEYLAKNFPPKAAPK